MSYTDLNTMLFTVTFTIPDGEDVFDVLDRLTAVLASTVGVEGAECLDQRPLDELRSQMRTLVNARLQLALNDLDRELPDLLEGAFKRGVTSMLSQS